MIIIIVFVTSARTPRVLATSRGQVIDWRDANPHKEGNAQARSHELDSHEFKSWFRKKIVYHKISIKVYLYDDHLALKIVHKTGESCKLSRGDGLSGKCSPNMKRKLLKNNACFHNCGFVDLTID